MDNNGRIRVRTWQEIAQAVILETDPERLTKLVEELTRALDDRNRIREVPSGDTGKAADVRQH